MTNQTRIIRNPGFTGEKYESGEYVLLNEETGTVHALNGSASMIYEMCDDVLCSEAAKRYADLFRVEEMVSREEIQKDFMEFIGQMAEQGLIILEDS